MNQLDEYRAILRSIKDARTQHDVLECDYLAKVAVTLEQITPRQGILLSMAVRAMAKALACTKFTSVAALEIAYTKIHQDNPLFEGETDVRFFFMWLLVKRRMQLFRESEFGQGFTDLFRNHPKLVIAKLDGRMIQASGRGQ